ncbi:MAG: hypothetical protein AAFQ66_09100 [Pseudomonadota bacterium]
MELVSIAVIESGRSIELILKNRNRLIGLTVDESFLGEDVAPRHTIEHRLDHARANLNTILAAYLARSRGQWIDGPFSRMRIEECDT